MRQHRTLIRTVVLMILIAAFGFTIFQTIFLKEEHPVEVGEIAPDFTLPTLEGQAITLSELKGKAVIVNFWGTYCPPCVREMPLIQEKYEKYKDQGLEIVAVNIGENKVTISAFLRRLSNIDFPIAMDPKRDLTKVYDIGQMPATVFIRPDGTVIEITKMNISPNKAIFVGELSDKILEENIERILP